jgi:hypothetical protein
MEQLSRRIKYWEYGHERKWRELKTDFHEQFINVLRVLFVQIKFWSSFLFFLKLKVIKNTLKISHWIMLFFLACVSSRALRLQRQPGEHILSEDLYRQLNESVNYSCFLRR